MPLIANVSTGWYAILWRLLPNTAILKTEGPVSKPTDRYTSGPTKRASCLWCWVGTLCARRNCPARRSNFIKAKVSGRLPEYGRAICPACEYSTKTYNAVDAHCIADMCRHIPCEVPLVFESVEVANAT